jgi:hypothetical protein
MTVTKGTSGSASIQRRSPLHAEAIERRIHLVRGQKVMLDKDLAELYGVPTKVFNQAVKRNRLRFPEDFMFRLTLAEGSELQRLRSQFVTLKRGRHIKYAPYAFTQEGVAMLSSVLHSGRAVEVNIAIMRAFVKLREIAATHKDLAQKLDALEKKYQRHDLQIKAVFDAIRKLIEAPATRSKRRIGFLEEAPHHP